MFNIPNLITALNLTCGCLSIFLSFSGRLDWACYLIYIAMIMDFLDGLLARLLHQQSEMGKQLDSLADMVTFGVAPGMLACIVLIIETQGGLAAPLSGDFHIQVAEMTSVFLNKLSTNQLAYSDYFCFVGMVIPFFSLFRLAKFNIDMRQTENFIGLPTPANALFFSAFPLLLLHYFNTESSNAVLEFLLNIGVFVAIIVGMSLLLIAEIPLFSLKMKHFKWKGNEVRFIFIFMSVAVLFIFKFWAILIIITLYLILSLIQHINFRKI